MESNGPPTSLLTHIALPVRDLDATLAFYERYTTLVNIHERMDPQTGLRSVWLANQQDVTEAAARFVIVLICGKLPTAVTGDIKEEYGFLRSISHLGISLDSRDDVDRVAAMAKEEGCLLLGRCIATRSSATSASSRTPTATTSSSPSSRCSAEARLLTSGRG